MFEETNFNVGDLQSGDLVKVTSNTKETTLSFWAKDGKGILTIDSPAILLFLEKRQKFNPMDRHGAMKAFNVFYFFVEESIIKVIRPGEGETMSWKKINILKEENE